MQIGEKKKLTGSHGDLGIVGDQGIQKSNEGSRINKTQFKSNLKYPQGSKTLLNCECVSAIQARRSSYAAIGSPPTLE